MNESKAAVAAPIDYAPTCTLEPCGTCEGLGMTYLAESDDEDGLLALELCPDCGGTGQVEYYHSYSVEEE